MLTNGNGDRYELDREWIQKLFNKIDSNNDYVIDWSEFEILWSKWLRTVLRPRSAFIIVDVQNDFISGTLSLSKCPSEHRGEEVIPVINQLLKSVPFDLVVYSYDWHPDDHISFYENHMKRKIIGHNDATIAENLNIDVQLFEEVTFEGPPQTSQILWPRHCVQNTWGSELHPDLKVTQDLDHVNVYKGTNPLIDSYSAFWDNGKLSETSLNSELMSRNITDVYVCGLAYDVCVNFTAAHANEAGYRTVLVDDASRGVDLKTIERVKSNLTSNDIMILNSDSVLDMVTGRDRRPELARRLAASL